jgi:hypothetical protein
MVKYRGGDWFTDQDHIDPRAKRSFRIYFIVYKLYYVGQNNNLGIRISLKNWDRGSTCYVRYSFYALTLNLNHQNLRSMVRIFLDHVN